MSDNIILSGYHIKKILERTDGKIKISLDLGITKSDVAKEGGKVVFPDSQELGTDLLARTARKRRPEDCFLVREGSLVHIYAMEGNSIYRLYESKIDWPPTLWINGSMMHTISVSRPTDHAKNELRALGGHLGASS